MASGQEPVAPQIPQQGTAEVRRGGVTPYRHPDSSNAARIEHGALAHYEYGLLVPEETAGNPASA